MKPKEEANTETMEKSVTDHLVGVVSNRHIHQANKGTIEQRPSRELADDVIPQPKDRATWFLAACFVLFCLAWLRDA